jgi:hypothetical protein
MNVTPHALRRGGHFDILYAQRRQRIEDGIDQRRRRRCAAYPFNSLSMMPATCDWCADFKAIICDSKRYDVSYAR